MHVGLAFSQELLLDFLIPEVYVVAVDWEHSHGFREIILFQKDFFHHCDESLSGDGIPVLVEHTPLLDRLLIKEFVIKNLDPQISTRLVDVVRDSLLELARNSGGVKRRGMRPRVLGLLEF